MTELTHCITANILDKQRIIDNLREELRKLREEYNKDEEIAELIAERDRYKEDYWKGFPISEEEDNKINEWIRDHDKEHPVIYGTAKYEYIFTPTGLGIIGSVLCSCGKSFCFQDMG